MDTQAYHAKKMTPDGVEAVKDDLTVEEGLQIMINHKPFSLTMRTPGNDDDLIRGLLYNEDVYRGTEKLVIQYQKLENDIITEANIDIDPSVIKAGYSNSRNFLSASSCGICGKTELPEVDYKDKLEGKAKMSFDLIEGMFEEMAEEQIGFKQTGGCHAAAAFSMDGELLCVREDIGRHNAVDKVVGHLLNGNKHENAKCITVSGRISYEIVAKAFAAKIPILAAVSAPSSLAVDFAKELGITLLAFSRSGKSTCYSHPERITELTQ